MKAFIRWVSLKSTFWGFVVSEGTLASSLRLLSLMLLLLLPSLRSESLQETRVFVLWFESELRFACGVNVNVSVRVRGRYSVENVTIYNDNVGWNWEFQTQSAWTNSEN